MRWATTRSCRSPAGTGTGWASSRTCWERTCWASGTFSVSRATIRPWGITRMPNRDIPGRAVPEEMIAELRAAGDKHALDVGVEIAVRTIKAVRPHCDGVHIMAIKAIDRLPEILTKAALG